MTKYEKEDEKLFWILISSTLIALLIIALLFKLIKYILLW